MKIHNKKGIAIFITLVFLFILSSIVIIALLTSYNYSSVCEGQIKRLKAIALAESGINYAYYNLRVDPATFTSDHGSELTADTIIMSGDEPIIKVWVTGPVSGRYTIKSKVAY